MLYLASATFAALAGMSAASVAMKEPLILPSKSSGPPKLLIIVPAMGPAEAYQSVGAEVQAAASSGVVVGIPRCSSRLPPPNQYLCDPEYEIFDVIPDIITRVNASLKGGLTPGDVFVGGHSVSGAAARRFVDTKYKQAGGVVTLGTQYTGDSDSMLDYLGYPSDPKTYPLPFLGVTGELDKFPTSHTALFIKELRKLSMEDQLLKYAAILPGLDQSSFMADPYSSDGDIVAEVSRADGQKAAGALIGAWVDHVTGVGGQSPATALAAAVKDTDAIAAPFIAALAVDRGACVAAQRLLPLVSSDSNISLRHVPFSKLDSCHTTYAVGKGGELDLDLCDYSAYNYGHRPPWQPTYAGAQDISCKMISEDRIAQVLNKSMPDMKAGSVVNRCRQINEASIATAKKLVNKTWPRSLTRFASQGKKLVFRNDSQTVAGPQWLVEAMTFAENTDEIDVGGLALITTVKSMIYPGNHYCKFLSPSMAVEVVMTMGLSKRLKAGSSKEAVPVATPSAVLV
jgi:hypothetical protein